jgi:16S rRNA C1402 N4-methylase RsmH
MDPQARIVYEHLSRHDGVGEADVIRMLGGTRAARRFARRIEEYNRLAPFVVRLESANNIKRYVRAREVTE